MGFYNKIQTGERRKSMKNKYVMSRLLALGMAATLTAGNLPMVANAADETVKVSEATEQKAEDTEVETQETENPQAENVEQVETPETETPEQTENQGTVEKTEQTEAENVQNAAVPQLNTGLMQAGKYDASGNWVAMSGTELLTNDQIIFNLRTMVPEGFNYNSANILVDGEWIRADEGGYAVVNKTSTVTKVGMWLEQNGQVVQEPVMADVNYHITVDQTKPTIDEFHMWTMEANGKYEDFESGVTNKDVMVDVVANDDVEVDYVFYTSSTGSTPVFEKIPNTNENAYRYIFKEDGVYNGVISVKDKAGNYTEKAVSFTIDKTAPTLDELHMYAINEDGTFADLADGGKTDKKVMVDVVANDNVEVDYVFYTSEAGATPVFEKVPNTTENAYRHVFEKPGTYNGVISVKDKAGNYTEKNVSFTIQEKRDTLMVISFETRDGKKVGQEVVKKQGIDGEDVNFELGKDFQLPTGYKLAEENKVETITVPAGTTGGHVVLVDKGGNSSIANVQFVDAETNEVIGGGDYFVDGDGDGIFTHREVVEYVPEGYVLTEFGDFQVSESPLQLSVVKKEKESVVKIQFVDSITNEVVAGGDYFVDKDRDGIFNHSEVEQWVPEEYRLVEFGDFQVSECKETPLQLTVEKVNKSSIVNVQFVDAETNEVIGGGDYFVDGDGDGIFTHREVVEYVPEGYELAEFGDFQVAECKDTPLQLSVVKIKNDVKPDPENPDKPNPEKPDSEKPGNPDQEKPNNPDPEKPNKPDTQKPNKSNKNNTNADKKTPKTGDDLQAAGAFSVLGAGALAAIAALLKKRK